MKTSCLREEIKDFGVSMFWMSAKSRISAGAVCRSHAHMNYSTLTPKLLQNNSQTWQYRFGTHSIDTIYYIPSLHSSMLHEKLHSGRGPNMAAIGFRAIRAA